MNTTASTRIIWVVITMILTASSVMAAQPQSGDVPQASTGGTQATGSTAGDKSQQAADLLRRARQAMAENDLAAAESLIAQAEARDVQYNSFHLGDTPKKARRDLERKRSAAAPAKPSQLFSPFAGSKKNVPANDPFAGRSNNAPAVLPDVKQVMPLPRVDLSVSAKLQDGSNAASAQAAAPPNYPSTEPNENDLALPSFLVKGSSDRGPPAGTEIRIGGGSTLIAARRALAVGDTRRAQDLVQQAKNQNLQYGPLEDTPEKVEAAIRKMQDLTSLDKNTEAYRRAYARNVIDQSEAFLRHGELDEAERLANLAAQQQVTYTPIETKPQDLLARLAVMRHAGNLAAGAVPGVGDVPNPALMPLFPRPRRIQSLSYSARREALAAGQLDRAEELVHKADRLHLPDSAFPPGEDRPGLVLSDIRQVRQREPQAVLPAANFEVVQAAGVPDKRNTASAAVYNPANDPTRNVTAANDQAAALQASRLNNPPQGRSLAMAAQPVLSEPIATPNPDKTSAAPGSAMDLFLQGEAALKAHDKDRAYQFFRQAAAHMNELNPAVAQRLQDHLQLLTPTHAATQPGGQSPNMLDETAARQQVLARQVAADLAHLEANARAAQNPIPTAP